MKASKMASSEVKRTKYNFESKLARNIKTDVNPFMLTSDRKVVVDPELVHLRTVQGR